jgi:MFS family permease
VIVVALLVGAGASTTLIWGAAAPLVLVAAFTLIGASVNGALPLLAVRVVALGDSAAVGVGSILAGLRMGQSSGTFLGPAMAGLVLALAGLNAGWLAQAGCLLASLALHELSATRAAQRQPSLPRRQSLLPTRKSKSAP